MSAMPTRHRRSSRDRLMVTPEGVAFPLTVASRGARVGAVTLDFLLIIVMIVAVTWGLIAIAGGVRSLDQAVETKGAAGHAVQFLIIVWIVAMFLFRHAYFLFFELGPQGATPGKRVVGIRIASRDGGRLTAQMVIARNLLRDIELFLPVVLILQAGADSGIGWIVATCWFAIFLLFPFFNRDCLRAGDVIAGSWVVERPATKLAAAMSVENEVDRVRTYRFSDAELAVYGEYELQALERVLRDDRAQTVESVYHAIAQKIDRNDGWNDERAFLDAYYTQLRARLEAGMRMGRRKADKHVGTGN